MPTIAKVLTKPQYEFLKLFTYPNAELRDAPLGVCAETVYSSPEIEEIGNDIAKSTIDACLVRCLVQYVETEQEAMDDNRTYRRGRITDMGEQAFNEYCRANNTDETFAGLVDKGVKVLGVLLDRKSRKEIDVRTTESDLPSRRSIYLEGVGYRSHRLTISVRNNWRDNTGKRYARILMPTLWYLADEIDSMIELLQKAKQIAADFQLELDEQTKQENTNAH